jgi:hypothetical protein
MEKTNFKLMPNTTQLPNLVLDLLIPRLPEAEARCFLYICRRTYGFHRESDKISFSQFINGIVGRDGKRLDHGTGLSRQSVSMALKHLAYAKAISVVKSRATNSYKINLLMSVTEVVKLVDQSRKLTASSLASRPKQVKLLDLQKKGKKEKIDFSNQVLIKTVDNSDVEEKINLDRRTKMLTEMRKTLIKSKVLH